MEAVLDPPILASGVDLQWAAVRTHSLRERAVADALSAMGVEHFYPVERVRQYRRGRGFQTVCRPLYPSYLFAAFHDEWDRHEIRRTKYVADVILDSHPERLAAEVHSLEIVLSQNPFAEVADHFAKGVRVKVVRGPLESVEGEIIRRERKVKGEVIVRDVLRLTVLTLGRFVEIDVPPEFCEPL